MTDEESVAIVFEVKDMALALREARNQRDNLRAELEDLIDVALELDELVHYDRGAGKYVEDKGITKARAALAGMEDEG